MISNEKFRVTASPVDGSLAVLDLETGRRMEGLGRFVSEVADATIDAPTAPPAVRVLESGPVRRRLEIELTYPDRRIRSVVTLVADVPRIDIMTEVGEDACDHRLRVLFPSGIRTARAIELPKADKTWWEQPAGTFPTQRFVGVSDGKQGLMIANRALPEHEALEGPGGVVTLALTLVRGPQDGGRRLFEYSIIPHQADWRASWRQARAFGLPMRVSFAAKGIGALEPAPAPARLDAESAGSFVISAVRHAAGGEGVTIRVYNIFDAPARGQLRFGPLPVGMRSDRNVDLFTPERA